MEPTKIKEIFHAQKVYFNEKAVFPLKFRLEQLRKLRNMIESNENMIIDALYEDLHKPATESYASEIGIVLVELEHVMKQLPKWIKPTKVRGPIYLFPSKGFVEYEPLGVSLIIAPWNYPFQLLISPLIGSIAGGNCSVLKPSELAPKSADVITNLISEYFNPEYIASVEGAVETSKTLLDLDFDKIFFTGSPQVGKIVMSAASKNLTPVTLELGGKSPCIVDYDTNINVTARRIVWGKFYNAGQTCIAPDYVLVQKSVKNKLIEKMKYHIEKFFGDNPAESPDYGRIINDKHYYRIIQYLNDGEIVFGGNTNADDRYIEPTLIIKVKEDDKIMQDEIFGPILPILEYNDLEDAIKFVNKRPKPLSLYVFSNDKYKQDKVDSNVFAGSCCINDTVIHVANTRLPFGGVGTSGMGSYHGKDSFLSFVNKKSCIKKTFYFDSSLRYPPYKNKLKWLRKLFNLSK